ncbi:MAG: nitroreductase family protein [Muribaculaceae bacterium]|nr:nitroreductase family protein [Muribaculaceae bacterium]
MVMNAIVSRKSVRKYQDKAVEDSVVEKILEAGRLAPSWVNVQPWKFIVVKSQAAKDLLSDAAGGQKQVKTAPVVICAVADLDSWDRTNFGKVLAQKGLDDAAIDGVVSSKLLNPSNLGEYLAMLRSVEQLTYAVAYMTLEAEELGVGCCVVGAAANELTKTSDEMIKKVKELLGLNNRQILVDMLTLGYEDSSIPSKKLRKAFNDVVFYETLN